MKNIYRIIFTIVAFIFFFQSQQSVFCQENSSGIKVNVKVGMPFGTASTVPEGYKEK